MASIQTTLTAISGATPTAVSGTVPAATVDVLGVWTICNTYSLPITVYGSIQRGGVDYMLCNGGTLGVGNTLFLAGLLGKFGLQPGDVLRVWLGTSQTAHVAVTTAREP